MSITVEIPAVLRAECGGRRAVSLSANTVRGALECLERDYPSLYGSVCDETGTVRRHVSLFVNSMLIRGPAGLETALARGDVLAIMPAVSGG